MTVKEEFDALENDPRKRQCPKYPAISCVSDGCEGCTFNDLYDKAHSETEGKPMTVDEVKEFLKKDSMKEAVLIGSEDEREKYYPAIVGFDEEKGRVIYDYGLLCECFANEFRKSDEESGDLVVDHDYDTDGVEWVDYNVIRSLPYWGEHAPVVMSSDVNEEEQE